MGQRVGNHLYTHTHTHIDKQREREKGRHKHTSSPKAEGNTDYCNYPSCQPPFDSCSARLLILFIQSLSGTHKGTRKLPRYLTLVVKLEGSNDSKTLSTSSRLNTAKIKIGFLSPSRIFCRMCFDMASREVPAS